jgi:hypothetical protein
MLCYFKRYAGAADIIMLDPYPIGINLKRANHTYGCNGCDGCLQGTVSDVATRIASVSHSLGRSRCFSQEEEDKPLHLLKGKYFQQYDESSQNKELWVVLQAFGGGEGHWSRHPTATELRLQVYLSLIHGVSGVMLWLRENGTPQELVKATLDLRSVHKKKTLYRQSHS